MKIRERNVRNRIVKQISLFLCLVFTLSNLQIIQARAAVAVEGQHYLTPYQTSNYDIFDNEELKSFKMMGVEYYQGLQGGYYTGEMIALYNLDGDFTSVSFSVGHLDGASTDKSVLNVYTDNDLFTTIELTGDMTTQKVVIDTKNVQQLKFSGTSGWGRYCIANVIGTGGHVYESEVTKIATVKQDGIRTYTCKYCDNEYTETINARVDCVPLLQPYQSSNVEIYVNDEKSFFNVMGKRYYDGILAGYYTGSEEVLFNLAQNYSEVSFTVGHMDNASWDRTTLYVYSDGVQQKQVELTGDMINETVTVNTEGVTQLKIVLGSGWGRYALFDMNYVTDLSQEHSFEKKIDAVGGFITYTCENCGAYYMEAYNPEIKVTGISLDSSALEMRVGDTARLIATVSPENATDKTVTWSSEDTSVAVVDENGNVTAAGEGSTMIIASAENGEVTAQCEVTVEGQQDVNPPVTEPEDPVAVTDIVLDSEVLNLKVGDSSRLNATVLPSNATDKSVEWFSDDTSVATVDSNGNVRAVGEGSTIIIASAENGEVTAWCEVIVEKEQDVNPPVTEPEDPVAVTDIVLDSEVLNLKVGNSSRLNATVLPSNATDKSVEWFSDDTSVATVDSNGNVRAVGEGSTIIIASAENGEVAAWCEITVEREPDVNPPVQNEASLTLSTSAVTLYTGRVSNTAQITANVKGDSKSVTWQSSDPTVARVSSNGRISAVAKGTTTITATANDISKTVAVTVKNPTLTVKKSGKNVKAVTVKKKRTLKLSLDVKPAGSGISLQPITAKQKKIASVRISGNKLVIVGKKKGKFSIKLKSGATTKTVKITVKK